MIARALISNADSEFGLWTAELLAPLVARLVVAMPVSDSAAARRIASIANVEPVFVDCTTTMGWEQLAGNGDFDLIVDCPHPRLDRAGADEALTSAWLALKHSHALMAARGGGILVSLALAGDTPERCAALYGLRLSATAAILDAMKVGLTPRANRLIFSTGVHEAQFKAALALLTDARSAFMTGAEVKLSSRQAQPAASTRLDGKAIIVTGATSGIGRAIAVEVGRLGGWVAVGARKLDLAAETLAMVRAAGGDGCVLPLDVTEPDGWARAARQVLDARGGIDGLVNNAGEARNRAIAELSEADLGFLLGINYRGTLLGIRQCLGAITARGGAVVNISSVAGIRAAPGGSAYGGSKASVIGLTLGYADQAAGSSIRINAVQPGLIWSDSVADSLGEAGAAAFRAMIEPRTPLGRVGVPQDVAGPVAFLLSDAAAGISGQAISVSGGLEFNLP